MLSEINGHVMLTVNDLQKSSKFHKFSHFNMSQEIDLKKVVWLAKCFNVMAAILYELHSP